MERTFLACIHYDGTHFVGWQRQAEGRTVQGEFEAALERLSGRRIVAHAAGRTDAGVHALGMGVSCTLPARWTPSALRRALNALLPSECWVESVREAAPGFHARKSALGRRYRYDIGTDATSASPFRHRYEWALGRELNEGRLYGAASSILGEHEFSHFSVRSSTRPHYRCQVALAQWERRCDAPGFRFHVAADRFLHHMVRFLVGTMVDIGLERRPPEDLMRLLAGEAGMRTSPPAPARGLYFMAAEYPPTCFAPSDGVCP